MLPLTLWDCAGNYLLRACCCNRAEKDELHRYAEFPVPTDRSFINIIQTPDSLASERPPFGQHFLGNHLHRECDPEGNQDEVVEAAQDGNEVGNEVNRARALRASGRNLRARTTPGKKVEPAPCVVYDRAVHYPHSFEREFKGADMSSGITTINLGGVNCYLLRSETGFVLIDTGFQTRRARLDAELEKADCVPGKLKLILLTHRDVDQVGNCAHLSAN